MEKGVLPYKKLTIEISNICNAECKWCTTGIKNKENITKSNFMTTEEFIKGLNYLLNNKIIDNNTEVELYNWGEPFLNPNINEILEEICKKNLKYHLSTNASKAICFGKDILENLVYLVISLPGFSKESYDKIHCLNFDNIIDNIKIMSKHMKEIGFNEKIMINYHIYQFNLDEIELAQKFCEDLEVNFVPTFAYFNDFKLFNDFLLKKLDEETLYDSSKELFTHFYESILKKRPENYYCPELDYLVLDHKFNIIPCCRLTSSENIGNLFENDLSNIIELRKNLDCCSKCSNTGQDFIVHQYDLYPKWVNKYIKMIKENEQIKEEFEKYDLNLKTAISQRDGYKKEFEKYDLNLKVAISQRDVYKEEIEKYDFNLKAAISRREEKEIELEEYERNLKISIEQRELIGEKNKKYQYVINMLNEELLSNKKETANIKGKLLKIQNSKEFKFATIFNKNLRESFNEDNNNE